MPGCSLGIGDLRILHLLCIIIILQLNFARSLKELHSFVIILLLLYTVLLLLQFLMKTLKYIKHLCLETDTYGFSLTVIKILRNLLFYEKEKKPKRRITLSTG